MLCGYVPLLLIYQIVDLYELYEDLCPKKISGKRILRFQDFIHMIGAIDDLSVYLDHVLHLQHVSIIRNLKLWILFLTHKKIMGKEK